MQRNSKRFFARSTGRFVVYLLTAFVALFGANQGFALERGQVTGTKTVVYPDWFKDSFLDIAEDVAEARDEDKHLILFMDLNGCPYCYKMNEENFKHAPYKDFIQTHFDVIGLNIKGDREIALNEETSLSEKELADRLNVSFTPAVVFLDQENQVVAKVNGYRNVRDFKVILDYVQSKAYAEQKLADFIKNRKEKSAYVLREHPLFTDVADLSSVTQTPVALVFEDSGCIDCNALHEGHLASDEVMAALKDFSVVRIDALSDSQIRDFKGELTTHKELASALNVSYTPAIVLFDEGEEKLRLESMLYRYHFVGLLEYVGARHYKQYPESPFAYINAKTERLLAEGKDVSLSDE